jgi:hypothetical protein
MKKVANPFFKISKSFLKGVRVAGLSALAVGGLAASDHFIGELAPVLVTVIPGPFGVVAAALLASFGAGALEAIRNALAHRRVTPDELKRILTEEIAKEDADRARAVRAQDILDRLETAQERADGKGKKSYWPDA